MSFGNALLNVLAIIAIVAIGGLLVYYLGGLLLKVIDHKKDETKEVKETKPFVEEKTQQNFVVEQQKQPEPTYEETISEEKFVLDDNEKVENVDYNKATEEKRQIEGQSDIAEKNSKSEDVTDLFDEDKDFNFDDFDFDAFFDEQNKENAQKDEKPVETKVEEQAPAQYTEAELENLFSDEDFEAQPENAVVAQNVVETNNTAVSTNNYVAEHTNTTNTVETTKTIYVDNHEVEEQLRAEIEELKAELAEQRKLYEALKARSEENEQKWQEEKTSLEILYQESEQREQETAKLMQEQAGKSQTVLSIEEYTARLIVLQERLKENEYELKQNRKEFLPLKRVRKNLDKDKAKLRRREALVAKQKVVLYGVNNIADIDQEKAKKLAEDLDLLEGLKISVKHCEEVMEENKERYPILETANRILTTANNELKQDIHDCEVAILNLRKANGEDIDGIVLEPLELDEVEKPEKRKRGRPKKSDVAKQETQKVEEQEVNLTELKNSFDEEVTTVVHSAQTEENNLFEEAEELPLLAAIKEQTSVEETNVVEEKPVVETKVVTTEVVEPQTTTTTISVKKEEITKTQTVSNNQTTKTEHKFDFDAEEPSYEDLFAIENENLFEDDDDFFGRKDNK